MNMKKLIKVTIEVVIIIVIGYLIYDNYYTILNKTELFYVKHVKQEEKKKKIDGNEYQRKINYGYLQISYDTDIKDINMLRNAIYTFLDTGAQQYEIVCNPSYESCIDDARSIAQNNAYLTDISNFVHPYNSFEKINTSFTSTGRIIFKKDAKYSEEKIKVINAKIDELYNANYDSNKSIRDNIKTFHDLIINNTKYDVNNTTGDSSFSSSSAYGVLFDGLGICSGYTDTLALFLEKMNIPNYKISSSSHVWNLVYIDNNWYHIDLTWDDPIRSDGKDDLLDNYFLINTTALYNLNDGEHQFDENIYQEVKKTL